jgi:hypothetical protein
MPILSKATQLWRTNLPSLIALGFTLALVTTLYVPTLDDPFHGDDFVAFTEFKSKGLWEYSRDVFLFKDTNFYWRPLGSIFHYALYDAFGLNVVAFRLAALLFFLATLVCIYAFCRGERLGAWTGVLAALVFGVLPSHVVSVSWVTNTSRLTAALCLMTCLLALQRTRMTRRPIAWEGAAFLSFLVAVLSDEVTAALIGVPLLYASFLVRQEFKLVPSIARLLCYGAVVAIIVPLQFTYTIDDEMRLNDYGIGVHMVESFWVSASQLTLPLAEGGPMDVFLHRFHTLQWAAGVTTLAALAWFLLFGSRMTRFLALWCIVAILPFALWKPMNISPRYVYFAAMPFAILVAWACASVLNGIAALTSRPGWWPRLARVAGGAVALPVAVLLLVTAVRSTETRNQSWSGEVARYGVLRDALEDLEPPPKGSRIVIFYGGTWTDFWATAVARSVYGDPTLQTVTVLRRNVEYPFASQVNDHVLYMLGDRLLPATVRR